MIFSPGSAGCGTGRHKKTAGLFAGGFRNRGALNV
jgi:hypothetical protein